MKIKVILITVLSLMLLVDLISLPFLFEDGSLFNEGLKPYKYILGAGIAVIFWIYFVINFITEIDESISYKIASITIQERHRKSFDFHYKIVFRTISFLIITIIIFLFFLSVKNFDLVKNNMGALMALNIPIDLHPKLVPKVMRKI